MSSPEARSVALIRGIIAELSRNVTRPPTPGPARERPSRHLAPCPHLDSHAGTAQSDRMIATVSRPVSSAATALRVAAIEDLG
jgi:hypothetical protein